MYVRTLNIVVIINGDEKRLVKTIDSFSHLQRYAFLRLLQPFQGVFLLPYPLSYQSNRLSVTKQAIPFTNFPFYSLKNARFRRWFILAVFEWQ